MSQFITIFFYSLTVVLGYLFSLSSHTYYLPQLLAFISIIFVILFIYRVPYFTYLISLVINLIVFTTGGLSSPAFFLLYFLLFSVAFQNPPSTTLSISLVMVSVLSQSLDSPQSLLSLLSLLFITPLAWFVGRQYLQNLRLASDLAIEETDVFLWFSLKFRSTMRSILDTITALLYYPNLDPEFRNNLKKIKQSTQSLLKSSQKLTQDVDHQTDEI